MCLVILITTKISPCSVNKNYFGQEWPKEHCLYCYNIWLRVTNNIIHRFKIDPVMELSVCNIKPEWNLVKWILCRSFRAYLDVLEQSFYFMPSRKVYSHCLYLLIKTIPLLLFFFLIVALSVTVRDVNGTTRQVRFESVRSLRSFSTSPVTI